MDTRNFTFMFYGFLAAWVVLVGYVVSLAVRERSLKNELAQVRNLLKERERTS